MPKDWVWCWNCKGKAVVSACAISHFPYDADSCPHTPSCGSKRCNVCAGNCGWHHSIEKPEAAHGA